MSASFDATGVYYKELNQQIRDSVKKGKKTLTLKGVNGQRFIGTGIEGEHIRISVHGVPGNDLGSFMQGPTIEVFDNAQDGVANTMSAGKVMVHGHAGDVLGYGMRGGKLFVKGNIGYRVGIHMKSYKHHVPIIVSGGKAGDFLGEYMAGGILMLLDIAEQSKTKVNDPIAGNYIGTGMHGGVMYLRGNVNDYQLGKEVGKRPMEEDDKRIVEKLCEEFCTDMGYDGSEISVNDFQKLVPVTLRPYGNLYAY